MTNRELIRAVVHTLEKVEVRGSENMDRMLGCIQALGKMEQEMGNSEQSGDAALQQRDTKDTAGAI